MTAKGPRVHGADAGTKTVVLSNGMTVTGQLFDSNGDGTPDEIDIDGDGISDGEDINGDGVITIWADLVAGDDTTTETDLKTLLPATPAGSETKLASEAPLPGETPMGPVVDGKGGADLVNGEIPIGAPRTGVLAARNQAGIGSCAAFATAAAVTLLRYEREKVANASVDPNTLWPSPLYVYQYNASYTNGSCTGTNIVKNLKRYVMSGAPSEMELPYPPLDPFPTGTNAAYCTAPTTDAAEASANRNAFRIGGYVDVAGKDLVFRNSVKRQLELGRPVVFGTELPTDFLEFRASSQGVDVTKPFTGIGRCLNSGHCGGHAMVITAYDDARSAYRVLNSWGADWGDNGYLWWDYAALEGLGPYGSAVLQLPSDVAPLSMPDPNAAVNVVMMAAPTFSPLTMCCNQTGWAVILRVRWSEPVEVTGVKLSFDMGNTVNNTLDQAMLEGDIPGIISDSFQNAGFDPMPFVGKMGMFEITAKLRDGTAVSRMLGPITVPAPTM